MIYLHMPAEVSAKMIRQRSQETGAAVDIHEQDQEYLRACRESTREVAARLGWRVVDCAQEGAVRSPEDIHEELWTLVQPLTREK